MPTTSRVRPDPGESGRGNQPLAGRHAARATGRLVAASELMGTGDQLALPRLDGVVIEHHVSAGDEPTVGLAKTLLQLDVSVPEDWEKAKRDPTAYVWLTLSRWIAMHGGQAIKRRFGLTTTITSRLDEYSDRDGVNPNQLYITVDSVRAGYVVLGYGNATEAAFKELPLENFRVIHLAAHGVANTSFPDRAALLLGSSPAPGEDGLLQAREIRDLPLNADLVTLSACETGNGQLLGQEGIASLERAFLLAGAKAVIASLWTADDTFTISLMRLLYQHLGDGVDKGRALRQAKLDLLNQFGTQALPVYWADFKLVGDGSTAIFE